jgi:hypothetical protein
VRGDLGGTGKTIDWMKLERLAGFDLMVGAAAGDPERQDMQGARGKDRRGQRWSIALVVGVSGYCCCCCRRRRCSRCFQ